LTAAPFTVPPIDPDYKYQTVIILLTDGLNTQDRWYTSQSSIDAREQKTCDNIKAAGITMYTVQVNTGSDPASMLLQNCASDPGKYFLLTEAGQIVTTFGQIDNSLSKLRLAISIESIAPRRSGARPMRDTGYAAAPFYAGLIPASVQWRVNERSQQLCGIRSIRGKGRATTEALETVQIKSQSNA
jgi:hypothetical protein